MLVVVAIVLVVLVSVDGVMVVAVSSYCCSLLSYDMERITCKRERRRQAFLHSVERSEWHALANQSNNSIVDYPTKDNYSSNTHAG